MASLSMPFSRAGKRTCGQALYSTTGLFSSLAAKIASPKPSVSPGPCASVWDEALERAEVLAHSSGTGQKIASSLLESLAAHRDFSCLTRNIKKLVSTRHPFLNTVNQFYLNSSGKLLRPLIVLLLSRALEPASALQAKQHKLAEITEMIHTASLLHDDVLDAAHSRRSLLAAPLAFGNKAAVLSGDYLLAVASMELAKLGDLRVVETMASIITDLVHGEFMQLDVPFSSALQFDYYIEKSFRKTASLIANSCKSVALLASQSDSVQAAVYEFGKGLGIAFQLIDDKLDFEASDAEFGKSTGADLKAGMVTAPLLFAIEAFPEAKRLAERKFEHASDLAAALDYIERSDALAKTEQHAKQMVDGALLSLKALPPSEALDALSGLASAVIHRRR